MEETVTVFDWNFIYGIGLGLLIGAFAVYFWLKKGKMPSIKATPKAKQVKKHKKDELPDSDWPDASWEDDIKPVTPSNHESALG